FGVLIITIVYFPILTLTGIAGKMFHPMAMAVIFALIGALLLTLTLMPVLCSFLLRGKIQEGDNLAMRAVKAAYEPVLRGALRARWPVAIGAVAILALSGWVFTRLGAEFVPKLDEGSITAMLYKPVGMSLEESVKTDSEVVKRLLKD